MDSTLLRGLCRRFSAGEMEFGVLSQTAMAFRVIQGGLNVLVKVIARMAALAAETERIHELLTTLGAEADKETVATVQAPYGADIQAEVPLRACPWGSQGVPRLERGQRGCRAWSAWSCTATECDGHCCGVADCTAVLQALRRSTGGGGLCGPHICTYLHIFLDGPLG